MEPRRPVALDSALVLRPLAVSQAQPPPHQRPLSSSADAIASKPLTSPVPRAPQRDERWKQSAMMTQLASDSSAAPRRLSPAELDAFDAALESRVSCSGGSGDGDCGGCLSSRGSRGARSRDNAVEASEVEGAGKALRHEQHDQSPRRDHSKCHNGQSGGVSRRDAFIRDPNEKHKVTTFRHPNSNRSG